MGSMADAFRAEVLVLAMEQLVEPGVVVAVVVAVVAGLSRDE